LHEFRDFLAIVIMNPLALEDEPGERNIPAINAVELGSAEAQELTIAPE